MTRVYNTIWIRAPIERVFDYVTTPGNWPVWHPSSLGVSGATDHSLDPGERIVLPPESEHVDAEAELAVAIGAAGRRVAENDALALVAGYTAANDVTARDLQRSDGQWLRAKGFDSFCPVLPNLVSVDELHDAAGLRVVQRLNGEVLQEGTTSDLIFGVARLVAHASTVFTLEPGDVILTGTPAGVGVHRTPPIALRPGDLVEVEIERIGTLSNPVQGGR